MTTPKPVQFLLPASFLLVLGLGNLMVGFYKEQQYVQVYDELMRLDPSAAVQPTVGSLRAAQDIADRHLQRKREVTERYDFYRLVTFGGKAFCTLSLLLFTVAAGLAPFQKKRTADEVGDDPGALAPESIPSPSSAVFDTARAVSPSSGHTARSNG